MTKISYAGYRFPPEIIQQAIWLYLRFTFSFRDVEDLLAERGIAVSYETMRKVGVIDDATYKLTMRELNRAAPEETVFPLTGPDIRELRERARLSQAVFAKYLNLTVDHVSKLERGTKHPTGPALVLLNVIRRKGIEAIL